MQYLTKLFKLVELTRNMPQTGYVLAGIPQEELSNLAEHQYLVAFMAWQLADEANRAGAHLDTEKVLKFALVHDLGELLGGDIAMPYAKLNPRAYRRAKAFEQENQKYLAKFFGKNRAEFRKLSKEILSAKSDEAMVAKLADYIECTHYKLLAGKFVKTDLDLVQDKGGRYVKKIKDPVTRKLFSDFLKEWMKELPKNYPLLVSPYTRGRK